MSDKTREDYAKWKRDRDSDDSVIFPIEIWQAAKELYAPRAALSQKQEAVRYTHDGALKECFCGSLDVGGSLGKVYCYACGLSVSKEGPLKNAIEAWNKIPRRTAPPSTAQVSRDDVIQCIFSTHKQSEGVMADAILSLFNQPSQPTAQDGMVMVPVEPTQKMLTSAYDDAFMELPFRQSTCVAMAKKAYESMLKAASKGE